MSTPQGPNPPHGNPADPPAEQPPWGQQQYGGWGQQQGQQGQQGWDPDRTQSVDPRAWGQQSGPQQQQQAQGWPPQDQYGQQQYGGPPPGPQPTQQWAGGPQQQGWGPPGQQGWNQQATQQWTGQQPGAQQQWGGPSYPALPEPSPARSGRSKLPLILGGVGVLVVAAILVLGFVWPGFFLTRVFDAAAVQAGVQRVLTDDFDRQVTAVTCARDIRVITGSSFTCDATIDGATVKVPIKVTSDAGAYEVGPPPS